MTHCGTLQTSKAGTKLTVAKRLECNYTLGIGTPKGGTMGFLLRTTWKFVTSEEKSGSLLLTVALGKLYFEDESDGTKMTVKYRCVTAGQGKGPPVGANWSNTADPSNQFDNVGVMPGKYFGPLSFP